MKKLLVATIAFACALVLRADYTSYANVFNAIGAGASGTNDLKSTNGTWGEFSDGVTWNGGLKFDLEDNECIQFTVSENAAEDTNTVVKVEVKGVLTPLETNDFPTESDMTNRNAQLGFVIGIDTGVTPFTTNYYAWVGGASWTGLSHPAGAEPDVEGETDFIITFNYSGTHTVKFDIVTENGSVTNQLNGGNALTLTSAAGGSAGNVAGISCYGSGTLKSADGIVGLAVAELSNGERYGSLADAVSAAGTSATTVTVVRDTGNESVTIPSGSNISIYDPGNKASGSTITVDGNTAVNVIATDLEVPGGTNGVYTIPLHMAGSSTNINVILPGGIAAHKEAGSVEKVDNTLKVELQTRSDIIAALKPDTNNVEVALVANENLAALRNFIASDTGLNNEDVKADVTIDTLTNALNQVGSNGIAKWQSFVLGVETTDSVKPVGNPAGDKETSKIKLAIPLIGTKDWNGKSNYDVTYIVDGNTSTEISDTGDIELDTLPTTGGGTAGKTYTIKAVIAPK
ncbi:MAG: hypothetical protein J6T51_06945 [Kiritimatiellae bacterium]|nr:hypothetical protein [Kiritimatiellia bacterium]